MNEFCEFKNSNYQAITQTCRFWLRFFWCARLFRWQRLEIRAPQGPPWKKVGGGPGPPRHLWYQQIFNRQMFWHSLGVPPPGDPPKWTPQKSMFWTAQVSMPVCFDIRRYLTDKYFGVVWGCHPPWGPPKNQFLERLNLGCQSVMISADI